MGKLKAMMLLTAYDKYLKIIRKKMEIVIQNGIEIQRKKGNR